MHDKIKLYILAVMAAVVPLIVRIKVVPFVGFAKGQTNISQLVSGQRLNFFHYYKAVFLWVVAGALLFIMFGQLIDHKNRIKKDNKIFIAIGIIALFTILSAFMSDFRYVSIWGFYDRTEGLITYIAYLVVFLAAYSVDFSRTDLKPFKWGLIVSTVILSCIGIGQFYGHNFLETALAYKLSIPSELQPNMPTLTFRFQKIAYATLFNPNYVGSFTAITTPFFLGLFLFETEKKKKIAYFALSVLAFVFMVASGSRAGLVGILSASALLIGMNYKNFKRDWKRYASIIAVVFVIAFIMNFQNSDRVFGKINKLFSDVGVAYAQEKEEITETATESGDSSLKTEEIMQEKEETVKKESGIKYGEGFTTLGSGRGYIWYKTLGMMKDTIIIGNGPDTYIFKFPHADSFKEGFNKIADKPHNLYLQIGVNQGLIALLAFIFLNKYAFWKFLKQVGFGFSKRLDQILLMLDASLFGYLMTSLFNDSVVSVAPIYWVMLGIFLSILVNRKEMEKSKIFDM
ncbi:MAG: O-antigen ligase family protein [Peptostreptococcaceae bacterium]|nr:O-antigen ligase family protein [Peptostreptococcaceae bacterium]